MPFVQTANCTLFVTEAGPADAPPVLFSNSLGTTHRMWDAVVNELAADFRCIRYDTRGHGASTKSRQPFGIADLADDVVALLDNLNIEKAHFAGLSLGGMIGQSLAVRHPDRLSSLTLMATTAHMPPQGAWNDRAALVRREGTKAIVDATLVRWFTEAFRGLDSAALAQVRKEFIGIDSEGYAACCEAIGAMDFREPVQSIRMPTLIIAGENDPATPVAMAQALYAAIQNSTLIILSPAAHLLAVEQPAKTAEALRSFILGAPKSRSYSI